MSYSNYSQQKIREKNEHCMSKILLTSSKVKFLNSKAGWPEQNADAHVEAIQCLIQCVSIIQCFTPIAQPAAGLMPVASKRKHDRNGVSQKCSKTTDVSMLSETSLTVQLWVGVTWR